MLEMEGILENLKDVVGRLEQRRSQTLLKSMSRKVRQLVQIEEKFNGDFLARFADIFLRFIDVLRQNYSSRLLLNNRHRKLLLHNLAPIVEYGSCDGDSLALRIGSSVLSSFISIDKTAILFNKILLRVFLMSIGLIPANKRYEIIPNQIYMRKVCNTIQLCGDFEYQSMMLELLLRMNNKDVVAQNVKDWFTSETYQKKLIEFDYNCYDVSASDFLRLINNTMHCVRPVYCFKAYFGRNRILSGYRVPEETGIWLYFNLTSKSMELHCQHDFVSTNDEDPTREGVTEWETVTILNSNVINVVKNFTSEPSVWKFTFQLKGELISFVKKRADVFTSRSFIIYVDSSIGPEIWDFIEKAFLSDTIMIEDEDEDEEVMSYIESSQSTIAGSFNFDTRVATSTDQPLRSISRCSSLSSGVQSIIRAMNPNSSPLVYRSIEDDKENEVTIIPTVYQSRSKSDEYYTCDSGRNSVITIHDNSAVSQYPDPSLSKIREAIEYNEIIPETQNSNMTHYLDNLQLFPQQKVVTNQPIVDFNLNEISESDQEMHAEYSKQIQALGNRYATNYENEEKRNVTVTNITETDVYTVCDDDTTKQVAVNEEQGTRVICRTISNTVFDVKKVYTNQNIENQQSTNEADIPIVATNDQNSENNKFVCQSVPYNVDKDDDIAIIGSDSEYEVDHFVQKNLQRIQMEFDNYFAKERAKEGDADIDEPGIFRFSEMDDRYEAATTVTKQTVYVSCLINEITSPVSCEKANSKNSINFMELDDSDDNNCERVTTAVEVHEENVDCGKSLEANIADKNLETNIAGLQAKSDKSSEDHDAGLQTKSINVTVNDPKDVNDVIKKKLKTPTKKIPVEEKEIVENEMNVVKPIMSMASSKNTEKQDNIEQESVDDNNDNNIETLKQTKADGKNGKILKNKKDIQKDIPVKELNLQTSSKSKNLDSNDVSSAKDINTKKVSNITLKKQLNKVNEKDNTGCEVRKEVNLQSSLKAKKNSVTPKKQDVKIKKPNNQLLEMNKKKLPARKCRKKAIVEEENSFENNQQLATTEKEDVDMKKQSKVSDQEILRKKNEENAGVEEFDQITQILPEYALLPCVKNIVEDAAKNDIQDMNVTKLLATVNIARIDNVKVSSNESLSKEDEKLNNTECDILESENALDVENATLEDNIKSNEKNLARAKSVKLKNAKSVSPTVQMNTGSSEIVNDNKGTENKPKILKSPIAKENIELSNDQKDLPKSGNNSDLEIDELNETEGTSVQVVIDFKVNNKSKDAYKTSMFRRSSFEDKILTPPNKDSVNEVILPIIDKAAVTTKKSNNAITKIGNGKSLAIKKNKNIVDTNTDVNKKQESPRKNDEISITKKNWRIVPKDKPKRRSLIKITKDDPDVLKREQSTVKTDEKQSDGIEKVTSMCIKQTNTESTLPVEQEIQTNIENTSTIKMANEADKIISNKTNEITSNSDIIPASIDSQSRVVSDDDKPNDIQAENVQHNEKLDSEEGNNSPSIVNHELVEVQVHEEWKHKIRTKANKTSAIQSKKSKTPIVKILDMQVLKPNQTSDKFDAITVVEKGSLPISSKQVQVHEQWKHKITTKVNKKSVLEHKESSPTVNILDIQNLNHEKSPDKFDAITVLDKGLSKNDTPNKESTNYKTPTKSKQVVINTYTSKRRKLMSYDDLTSKLYTPKRKPVQEEDFNVLSTNSKKEFMKNMEQQRKKEITDNYKKYKEEKHMSKENRYLNQLLNKYLNNSDNGVGSYLDKYLQLSNSNSLLCSKRKANDMPTYEEPIKRPRRISDNINIDGKSTEILEQFHNIVETMAKSNSQEELIVYLKAIINGSLKLSIAVDSAMKGLEYSVK